MKFHKNQKYYYMVKMTDSQTKLIGTAISQTAGGFMLDSGILYAAVPKYDLSLSTGEDAGLTYYFVNEKDEKNSVTNQNIIFENIWGAVKYIEENDLYQYVTLSESVKKELVELEKENK